MAQSPMVMCVWCWIGSLKITPRKKFFQGGFKLLKYLNFSDIFCTVPSMDHFVESWIYFKHDWALKKVLQNLALLKSTKTIKGQENSNSSFTLIFRENIPKRYNEDFRRFKLATEEYFLALKYLLNPCKALVVQIHET